MKLGYCEKNGMNGIMKITKIRPLCIGCRVSQMLSWPAENSNRNVETGEEVPQSRNSGTLPRHRPFLRYYDVSCITVKIKSRYFKQKYTVVS